MWRVLDLLCLPWTRCKRPFIRSANVNVFCRWWHRKTLTYRIHSRCKQKHQVWTWFDSKFVCISLLGEPVGAAVGSQSQRAYRIPEPRPHPVCGCQSGLHWHGGSVARVRCSGKGLSIPTKIGSGKVVVTLNESELETYATSMADPRFPIPNLFLALYLLKTA